MVHFCQKKKETTQLKWNNPKKKYDSDTQEHIGSTCYVPGQNSDISLSLSPLFVFFLVYGMELDGCAWVIYRAEVACRVICKDLSKSCVFKELLKSKSGCMPFKSIIQKCQWY